MGKMKLYHKRRKRRTAKQGKGKSRHASKSGRTGSVHAKKLHSRNAGKGTHDGHGGHGC